MKRNSALTHYQSKAHILEQYKEVHELQIVTSDHCTKVKMNEDLTSSIHVATVLHALANEMSSERATSAMKYSNQQIARNTLLTQEMMIYRLRPAFRRHHLRVHLHYFL